MLERNSLSTRISNTIAMMSQKRKRPPIDFDNDDLIRVPLDYYGSLVITAEIGLYMVRRILIDEGTGHDFLYWGAF